MRLSDIEVDEVSLVDKAANKKKFAFLKRDDGKTEDKTDDKATVVTPAPVVNTDEPTAEELAQITALAKQVTELTALVNKK